MIKLALVGFTLLLVPSLPAIQLVTPGTVGEALLAADRQFSATSVNSDLFSALNQMFSDDVVVIVAGRSYDGKTAALDALRAARIVTNGVRWSPARVGVSADGRHGFTAGYISADADGTPEPAKYLAYWVNTGGGWRVAVYKRVRTQKSPAGPQPVVRMLPDRMVPPREDAGAAGHGESLADAERAFSREAQSIGLGPAFEKYGSADAINLGGTDTPTFVEGNRAIGNYIGRGSPGTTSPVSWQPGRVIAATSGDLGVTIGTITANAVQPGETQPRSVAFFTIWRRASAAEPWRYIAE